MQKRLDFRKNWSIRCVVLVVFCNPGHLLLCWRYRLFFPLSPSYPVSLQAFWTSMHYYLLTSLTSLSCCCMDEQLTGDALWAWLWQTAYCFAINWLSFPMAPSIWPQSENCCPSPAGLAHSLTQLSKGTADFPSSRRGLTVCGKPSLGIGSC